MIQATSSNANTSTLSASARQQNDHNRQHCAAVVYPNQPNQVQVDQECATDDEIPPSYEQVINESTL